MSVDTNSLPDNVKDLQSLVGELTEDRDRYKRLFEDYRRKLFGRSSERLHLEELEQSRLFNEAELVTATAEENTNVKGHKRAKKGKSKDRKPTIPDDLPSIEIPHDISDEEKVCPCCEEKMGKIRDDIRSELQVIPEQVVVHKHIHPVYACSSCKDDSTVVSAKRKRLLAGTIVGATLLAFIVQRKFQFGLPLYRISSMFKAFNVEISRQSMSNWILSAAEKLMPLHAIMKSELVKAPAIGIDETTLQVLNEKGRKNSQTSFMWHMRASPRDGPLCIFEYQTSRSAEHLRSLLTDYDGAMLTDGLETYAKLAASLNITHAGCWAHARRYFYKAYLENKEDGTNLRFLVNIRKLFRLERIYQSRKHTAEMKLKWRQRFSKRVIEAIRDDLDKFKESIRPKSSLGKAIRYTGGQWAKLIAFLDRPDAPIHNNDVERGIRPFVIGRKNWVFNASPKGAHASALFYSLVESAKANGLNPYDYLTWLIEKFPHCQNEEEMRELLPNRVTLKHLHDFFAQYAQL